jgi:hypothetical protein
MRRLASPGFLAIGQMKKGPHQQPLFKIRGAPGKIRISTPWFVGVDSERK